MNDDSLSLFNIGEFWLHGGDFSAFKIDCDALSDYDIEVLATQVASRFRFSGVKGIPRGGLRLATALEKYVVPNLELPMLIVDDVYTTGRSMRQHRSGNCIGVVIFARTNPPEWIHPIFEWKLPPIEGSQ